MSDAFNYNPFEYDQSLENAKKAHNEGFFLESIGIVFSSIGTMLEIIIMMVYPTNEEKIFEYLAATKFLSENNVIESNFKKRLDDYRCFRNKLIHSIALHREKISKQEIDEEFEKGIKLHEEVMYLGNEYFAEYYENIND